MRLFGLTISRKKALTVPQEKALSGVDSNRGWFRILESFSGAWQRNVEVNNDLVLSYPAFFACVTLIASDIAKLRVKLVERTEKGIWQETKNAAYDPVLRKPNSYQTRIQFWESWVLSKLISGNTYVLKQRDRRGVVIAMHVLDPQRVTVLISDEGSVFYQLSSDKLAGQKERVAVPAREIIHDRFNCLFHPMVGLSPIFASGLAATQGREIQVNSTKFFANKAQPSGILTTPNNIDAEAAKLIKEQWERNYGGRDNAGKIAVVGNDLKFSSLTMTSVDAQLIEQLRWTAEIICSTFHVPPYKIGVGQMPAYNNIQALNVEYYSQALQSMIEAAELCLDEGLEMANGVGTEFDLDGLLRMDSVTQMDVLAKAAGILTIDEQRAKLDRKPTEGGDTVYLQEQNYSLAALAKRDAQADPFGTAKPPQAPPANDDEAGGDDSGQGVEARAIGNGFVVKCFQTPIAGFANV